VSSAVSSAGTDRLINEFSQLLTHYSKEEYNLIIDAARWSAQMHAGQTRASGEPYFIHPLGVAAILVEMKMDAATIVAALLHDVEEDTAAGPEELRARYGDETERLVDGVTKISLDSVESKREQNTETLKKLFVAMRKDIRVIFIKLADKLHNMETLGFKGREKQIKTAQECLEIYAPLAGKLGIYWLKTRLEDLSLKYTDPEGYSAVDEYLKIKLSEQQHLLEKVEAGLRLYLTEGNIVRILSVPHNHYALYRSIRHHGQSLAALHYPFGVRIICKSAADCYHVLGLVHRLYKPVEGQFRDFIASPKENQYRGLHTVVLGVSGQAFEVQIRSRDMDNTAEFGVLSFWLFDSSAHFNPHDVSLIGRLADWEELNVHGEKYVSGIKKDVLDTALGVFDHEGNYYAVPEGFTALDFAFLQKKEAACHTIKILVNGQETAFDSLLHGGQVIQILTEAGKAEPSLEWFNWVASGLAAVLLRQWYERKGYRVIEERQLYLAVPLGITAEQSVYFSDGCRPAVSDALAFCITEKGFEVYGQSCHRPCRTVYEAVWKKGACRLLRLHIEAVYTAQLFGDIERAVTGRHMLLVSGSLHRAGHIPTAGGDMVTGLFTVQIFTEEAAAGLIEALKQIDAIKAVMED
jgi:guanosine-3',5'-bis(diphosphate) 3'-pyrophosphohydrolase